DEAAAEGEEGFVDVGVAVVAGEQPFERCSRWASSGVLSLRRQSVFRCGRGGYLMALRVGQSVPGQTVPAHVRGERGPSEFSLSSHRGGWVVLFFYPRDFTFICPTELASFAERHDDFLNERAVVLGASTDSFFSHKAWFESDPRLAGVSYPVIADTAHELSRSFDVLLEDGATHRGTFIIDPTG